MDIQWSRDWNDMSESEKIDELQQILIVATQTIMSLVGDIQSISRSGKLLTEAMLVMNRAAQEDQQRIKSLERRVDGMTNKDGTATLWSMN